MEIGVDCYVRLKGNDLITILNMVELCFMNSVNPGMSDEQLETMTKFHKLCDDAVEKNGGCPKDN